LGSVLKSTDQRPPAAHEGVYARLGVSPIHGVGVFAIGHIPRGTNVFGNDAGPIAWTPVKMVLEAQLPPALLRLYHDFGVVRRDLIGAPVNFNSLTPGWYVNEPATGQDANLSMTEDFHLIAVRDIEPGEELTATYASFSDPPGVRSVRLL
jgi:hypothetical protein